jgi:probable phosphoglycerate mutase
MDIPLSQEGWVQAENLRQYFRGIDLNVYCSDLLRTRQTAEHIISGTARKAILRHELREISLGQWEGKLIADIRRLHPEEYRRRGENIAQYRPPGGESFEDCNARVVDAFHDIIETSVKDVLIISHAGVNRLLLCHILGLPVANLLRIAQDYGCINIVSDDKMYLQVKEMNMMPHSR